MMPLGPLSLGQSGMPSTSPSGLHVNDATIPCCDLGQAAIAEATCRAGGGSRKRCRLVYFTAAALAACTIALAGCSTPSAESTGKYPTATAARTTATARGPSGASVGLFAATSATATAAFTPDYWPTNGWRTSSPEKQGMDSARLAALTSAVDNSKLNVHSVLVVRNGYLVYENYTSSYTDATPHVSFSVTKSVVATLVGMAADRGLVPSLQTPVLDLYPGRQITNVDDRKRALTLRDLLTMRSGFDWNEARDAHGGFERSANWLDYMLNLPMAEQPGKTFNYCSGCSHLLSEVVQQSVGEPTVDFARAELFAPLGIKDYGWSTDPDGTACGGWGLNLTPRDMAKLGYLYLNEGRWGNRQVISADFVRQATTPSVSFNDGFGYGYQWWTYKDLDGYFARGKQGQLVVVVPKKQLVVVFTSNTPSDIPLLKMIQDYVIPAVR